MPAPISLYIDADACPVKDEVYRVAERHLLKGVALKIFVVSNSFINTPQEFTIGARGADQFTQSAQSLIAGAKPDATFAGLAPYIERVIVADGMDEADDWIAGRAKRGDIVITADVPLAARAVKAGADAIAPNGKPFTPDSIGHVLATRNLMADLRSAGAITSGPRPFAPRDRSRFLSALDLAIVRLTRAGFGRAGG